jgi:hypothetical protein
MLVEDIECLLGGGELDGQNALAVINRLGCTLAHLCAFAIGSAVLVEQRVIAVVGEAKAVILSAIPAIVEAVAVPIDLLYGIHTALCYCPLLPHLVFGVWRRLQRFCDSQLDFVLHFLGPIVRLDGFSEARSRRKSGVWKRLILRRSAIWGRRVAGGCTGLLLLLLLLRRRMR